MITAAGIPYTEWARSSADVRWATDEECRAEFGVSRQRFLELWRETYAMDWWKVVNALRERRPEVNVRVYR